MVEMKDSGIKWVGKIPEDWEVKANKYIMHKIKHINPVYHGEDILSLTINGVIVRDLEAGGKMPTSFNGYQKLYPNNLLMCLFDYDVTPRCIGLINNYGITSPAYSQFILKDGNDAGYYYYYYLMIDYTKELLHLAKNLRHSFTEEQLGCIPAPVPPASLQKRIADYLNTKCTEIDSLISDIQKEIEILEEYKKSVITEAVTKGLDPDVEMKDSGIIGIGVYPMHWDLLFLKYVTKFQEGPGIMGDDFKDEGIPLIRISGMKGSIVTKEGCNYLDPNKVRSKWNHFKLQKNDVVISASASMGIAAIVDEEAEGCIPYTGLIRFPINYRINHMFLKYYLISNAYMEQINIQKTGSTIQHYGPTHINKVQIALPDIDEQNKIAGFLNLKCLETDLAIKEKSTQLETLEEYKKSLIYEYVTGKKQVPESEKGEERNE